MCCVHLQACTMDLQKDRLVHAAHTYVGSHIFGHVCTSTPFAHSRGQDSQVSQLSQCVPTATPLPDPAAFPSAVEPLCLKTRYAPRLPSGTCSRCLRAKKRNVLVLHVNCTLVTPKRAVRRQLHHANCFALFIYLFGPLSLQTHNLLHLREPTVRVSLCNKLLLGAAGGVHAEWKGSPPLFREGLAKAGHLLGTGGLARPRWAVVAPVRPTTSSPRCLNILCRCAARDVTVNEYICQINSLPT